MLKRISILFLLFSNILFAQNNTSSPYSLFGLGVENKTATGGLTGMGNTGIAQQDPLGINIYNPASLGSIMKGSFMYEIGVNGIYSTIKTDDISDTTNDANLSHIAIAFPISKNWGLSIGLLPYTKVGYDIDIENSIEGSTETYFTRTSGLGGLSELYLSSGFQIVKNLSLGIDFSVLYGIIDQESNVYSDYFVQISDANRYTGTKLKYGLQYTLPNYLGKRTTLGAILEMPTKLKGSQIRNSYKSSENDTQIIIDDEVENELDDFELPLAFGFGITSKINEKLTTSFDYKKLLWEDTNQLLNNERYVNQDIYAFGLEYQPSKNSFNYWHRVKYRFGLNYNTGFLDIANTQIDSYFVSAGLGMPLSKNERTRLNLSYSYGREGTINNGLIQENYHKLTINLSFVGNWFKKREIF